MTFPYYASAEQIMRDRSDLARKGIARGRSVVVLTYADGVLLVAENPSTTLRKVSEIYDRIGFAAVGRYNEFESLRKAGIQHADMRGYSYDRADVNGLSLANAYANTLGAVFTEQPKPYEVELCVAEVSKFGKPAASQLYRITYDGSITEESAFLVMGGSNESISTAMRAAHDPDADLQTAVRAAVAALGTPATSTNGSQSTGTAEKPRVLTPDDLEVAILDRNRPRRAYRRIQTQGLADLLPPVDAATADPDSAAGHGADTEGDSASS
ncbi:proteasome subunit alpha [Williamsia sterculiae]|uniref:Proteasome subunit alpha n=1 Tax=Williamsia sterculiae TaxID=1344003 RepID=A0A1N7EMN2_9NOCA|nr:proteasome subunit alpha [Williamsia sterculiae]SIR89336.1 proteasome alpha subunit [Williamsia sterculiae]